MRPISQKNRDIISSDPYYKKCARANGDCDGRITIEHVFIYSGRQIDEIWSLIPLCERHHSVCKYQDCGLLNKEINQWIALNRATSEDFAKYPKFDWFQRRKYLNSKYGNLSTLA